MEKGPRMEKFGRRLGEEIGIGYEKRVFQDADHSKQVVGVYHVDQHQNEATSEQFTRAQFYLHKILHLLYPEHFPNIHLDTTNPRAVAFEKVQLDAIHRLPYHPGFPEAYDRKIKEFERTVKGLGIILDTYVKNVSLSPSGDMQYVDTIWPWIAMNADEKWKNFDEQKMRSAIEERLKGKKKEQALRYIDRLADLYSESNSPAKKR